MNRISSYIIPIQLSNNKYIIIHGYTGAFDIIDKSLKDLLSTKGIVSVNDFPDSSTYATLKERGYITEKTQEEEREHVSKIAKLLFQETKLYPNQYSLIVTYNCNFDCPYCYEKTLFKRDQKEFTHVITKEQVNTFYERINKLDCESGKHYKYISLFGGEPLLKENKNIVKYIIEKGKSFGYSFTATTNGYDLDSFNDLLGIKNIERIQITIDGTQDTHDKRRIHIHHKQTFDKIINNIKTALDKEVFVSIRINVDNTNYNSLHLLNEQFKQLNFYSYKNFFAYASFISGDNNFIPKNYTNNQDYKAITQKDFLKVFQDYNLNIIHDIKTYTSIKDVLANNKQIKFYPYYCSSQTNMYIFDPFGFIYACLEIVGDKKHAIGIYNKREITWLNEKERWKEREISKIHKCAKCKYALFCGGGCFTKTFTDNLNAASFCDSFPTIFRYTVKEIYNKYCI